MITSLAEYLSALKGLESNWKLDNQKKPYHERENLWFRGQHDAGWPLTPKLYRKKFYSADENEIRQEFQSRAIQMIQGRAPVDKWEWYFLMQHYGAPTRLLDWTDNPLIALYFALADNPGGSDAAVWALNPWWLNKQMKKGVKGVILPDWSEAQSYLRDLEDAFETGAVGGEWPEHITARVPAAIDPPHVDRRVAAQSSRFVIFGKTHDLMKTKAARSRSRQVEKIKIPLKAIPAIQEEMYFCGITHSLVFPDLEGLCRDLCRKCSG